MKSKTIRIFILLIGFLLISCTKVAESGNSNIAQFTISGKVTFDWIPARDNVTEGGIKLDYNAKQVSPARRILVQAVDSEGNVYATTSTNDLGEYTLSDINSDGKSVYIRALARSTVTANTPDATHPNFCSGASWDLRVVDNVTGNSSSSSDPSLRPQHSAVSSSYYASDASSVNIHAATNYSSGYTDRTGAPFAILDVLLYQIELVCQSEANANFPKMFINWSENNNLTSGNKYSGNISSTHYTYEDHGDEDEVSNMYVLGKENIDTDEYDDHIIAHEFGHYLEDKLYRADSLGGIHTVADALDIRLAFGEGYGNALSAMTFNDTIYVDTSGSGQSTGFNINIASSATADAKAINSEFAVHSFLWSLYDARDTNPNSGSYDRIHNILKNYQAETTAFTSVHSFSSYYVQQYSKSDEDIENLFLNSFDLSINSLCSGSCPSSSATADIFDTDNDVGSTYASGTVTAKRYKQNTGSYYPSGFWKLYQTITSGVNSVSDHMKVDAGGYTSSSTGSTSYFGNKFGSRRFYRYVVPSATNTFKVVANSGSCTTDTLDMLVWTEGVAFMGDFSSTGSNAGCPDSSTITGIITGIPAGQVLLIEVFSKSTTTTSYTLTVTP